MFSKRKNSKHNHNETIEKEGRLYRHSSISLFFPHPFSALFLFFNGPIKHHLHESKQVVEVQTGRQTGRNPLHIKLSVFDTSQGHFRPPCREPLSLLITFKGRIFFRLWQTEELRDQSQGESITKCRQSEEGVRRGDKPARTNIVHCYFMKKYWTEVWCQSLTWF